MVEVTETLGRTGVVPAGEYSASKTYNFLDLVHAAPSSYVSKKDNNTGHAVSDSEWWQLSMDGSQSESAAKAAREAAMIADAAAKKADTAAEAVLQLPLVRTDMEQSLDTAERELARQNISAVGTLPIALSLSEDNVLSVSSALDTLSAHYKLYAANKGGYRWAMILSDASGAQVEEAEAEAVLADYVLHLTFRSQVTGQRYDLALSVSPDAVIEASVTPWRRTEQAGADTSSGSFLTTGVDLNKYDGDRGLEAYLRTGSDISTHQYIVSNNPLSLFVEQGRLYVNMWRLWTNSFDITPDTDYHVAVAFDKEKQEASLYINGDFISSHVREDTPPAYSTYNILGRMDTGDSPFRGIIYHARLFNYAPRREDVAAFYNNGAPAEYVVPAEMRGEGNNYQSDFSSGVDRWAANTAETTVVWKGGFLEASSESGHIRLRRTFSAAELATSRPHTYAFEVIIDGDPAFSHLQFYAFSVRSYTNVSKKDAEIIDGGLRIRGVVLREEKASFSAVCHCILYNAPAGAVVKIRSIKITPLSCIAEYLPQNVITVHRDAPRRYAYLSPMASDEWTQFADGSHPPVEESALLGSSTGVANTYNGGIYRTLPAGSDSFPYAAVISLRFKAKASVNGLEIIAGLGASAWELFAMSDEIALTTAWQDYQLTVVNSYPSMLTTICFYPDYYSTQKGTFLIKDVVAEEIESAPYKWLDSAKQLPINGGMPPLWSSVGGYDLTASGTPQIVYESGRRENAAVISEVLVESDCSLEGRISRLEKALIALTSGTMFIPKLSVKELGVWGNNNLILTGEGAPTKAPDRAGQIYIDTQNNAEYRSTGNAAVSDWKNA